MQPLSRWRFALLCLQVVHCALSMLTALAEEVGNMDPSRQQDLVASTHEQWNALVALVQTIVPQQVAAGARKSLSCCIILASVLLHSLSPTALTDAGYVAICQPSAIAFGHCGCQFAASCA